MFDVNVYLDLAELFGGPVTDLPATVAYALQRHGDRDNYPHPAFPDGHRTVDSLRAVALAARLGVSPAHRWTLTAAQTPWEICLSDHLLTTIDYKLRTGKGFGWSASDAQAFLRSVVVPLTTRTAGTIVRVTAPVHTPPLDHEDGRVLGGAIDASAQLLVTCDSTFVDESGTNGVAIEFPNQFIDRNLQYRRPLDPRSVARQLGWN